MSFFTKNFLSILFYFSLAGILVCGSAPETFARGGGHGGGGHSGGSVSVSGYSRSNGTYVSGYNRSAPSSHYSGNSRSSIGSSYSGTSYYSGGYHFNGRYTGRSSRTSNLGVSNHYLSSKTHYAGGTYKSGYAKVERSESAKRQFLHQQGLTRIPPGYHIDHIRPLSQGGSDTPSNMQLLSIEAHHQKTAAERRHY